VAESLKSAVVSAGLDGEVIALEADGPPSFSAIQQWLRPGKQPRTGHLSYIVFDCLYVNGHSLKDQPLRTASRSSRRSGIRSAAVRVTDALSSTVKNCTSSNGENCTIPNDENCTTSVE
jgi:ATP-dependent DNA ligase